VVRLFEFANLFHVRKHSLFFHSLVCGPFCAFPINVDASLASVLGPLSLSFLVKLIQSYNFNYYLFQARPVLGEFEYCIQKFLDFCCCCCFCFLAVLGFELRAFMLTGAN
jgi:hypothetical protein